MNIYMRSLKSQSYKQMSTWSRKRVLDLESEVMRGPAFIPTGVAFFTDFFFVFM